jgi:hypothetical protein
MDEPSDDVETTAARLSDLEDDADLDRVPVVAVEDGAERVELTLELSSGTRFSHSLSRPPVWGPNCELKTVLDAFGLGPDEVGELVGRRLPCERSVREDGIRFSVDAAALAD